jgi:nitroreductase
MAQRNPNHEIDPLFTQRWSPRAFENTAIPDTALDAGFEAARWAPSGGNSQPWRFVTSKRDSSSWTQFNGFLVDSNRLWAKESSALIVLLAKKDFFWGPDLVQSSSYSLDTGAAWMSFALQMTKLGWSTHAMAGFDKEKVRTELLIPENYSVEVMIAVGKIADKSKLPTELQGRESPSDRLALNQISFRDRLALPGSGS